MIQYLSRLFILFFLLYPFGENAFYYRASQWKKSNTRLILLYDHHTIPSDKTSYYRKTHDQRKDILNFLQNNDGIVIVEDLDDYTLEITDKLDTFLKDPVAYDPNTSQGLEIDKLLRQLKTIQTPLIGVTQCCHSLKIPVVNVDFRFFWLDSLKYNLTTKTAYNLCNKAIEEIKSYDDSEELNSLYKQKTNEMGPIFGTYKTFYDHLCNRTADKHINKLIDLKILHQIYNNENYQNIIVLAGGAHIYRIEKFLTALDYHQISITYKAGMVQEPLNLNNLLKSRLAA